MADISFIVNPISGNGKGRRLLPRIEMWAKEKRVIVECFYTKHKDHATSLARHCCDKGASIIVAVGGDGTVNEVARAVVGSSSILAIVPIGSGNGLARHLGIPMNARKAVMKIFDDYSVNKQPQIIDCGLINGQLFTSVAGIGFDAQVGYDFAQSGSRGISTYITCALRQFHHYKPDTFSIIFDGNERRISAQMIVVSNSNQWGNNVCIAPKACLDDGKLDLVIVRPFRNPFQGIHFLYCLITKTVHKHPLASTFQTSSVLITRDRSGIAHYDGEPLLVESNINISVIAKCLPILV